MPEIYIFDSLVMVLILDFIKIIIARNKYHLPDAQNFNEFVFVW